MAGQSKQRGHVEPHGKKFRAVVSSGKDPLTGRRRFLKETWPTEKEAEVAKTRLLNQVDEQRHPRSKILVRTLTRNGSRSKTTKTALVSGTPD